MLKYIFQSLITGYLLCLCACDPTDTGGGVDDKEVKGIWDPGAGLSHSFSFRNAQYTFEVKADKSTVDITLSSTDVNVALWLFNPLGQRVNYTWGDRTVTLLKTDLPAGLYTVVAGAQERQEKGKYTLSITGNVSSLTPIAGNSKIAIGNWNTKGGGLSHPESFRNRLYTVEVVNENSTLDLILESTGANGAI